MNNTGIISIGIPGMMLLFMAVSPIPIHSFNSVQQSPTDSLISLLTTIEDKQKRLDILLEITDLLNWEDLEKAKEYGFRALRLAEYLNDPIGKAFAMIEISHNYDSFMNKDSAIYYCHGAISIFKKHDHLPGIAQGELRLGYIAENEGDFAVATQHLYRALDLFEKAEDDHGTVKAFIGLGKLFFKMDQFKEGIKITKRSESLFSDEFTDEIKAYYHLVLGNNYKGAGMYDLALVHYNLCRQLAEVNKFNIDLIYTHTFMADIYQEQNQPALAREHYSKAIEYAKTYKDRNLQTFPFIGSGRLYNREGKYELAIEQFEAAMATKFDRVHNYYFHEIYRELSIAFSGLGKDSEALEHMTTYASLRDSFFTERSDRLRSEMQTKYETEKKEKAIQEKKIQLSLTLALLMLAVLGGIFFWRAFRAKKKMTKVLEERNEEKEFLIKEIHHRVKNNLQILASLLNLQSDYIHDPEVVEVVTEGLNRVQTMGLIHQKLYTGNDLAAVDMKDYIFDLSKHLLETFGLHDIIDVKISSSIPHLDVDSAIPLGLIINELMTNALKYAFIGMENGEISIELWINAADELCLNITDNGVGDNFPHAKKDSTSFGTDLIKILTKKLRGTITQTSKNGYSTCIRFTKYRTREKVSTS